MANQSDSADMTKQPSPSMVLPGERAILLSHRQYRQARGLGRGLDDYDLLMREPEDVGPEAVERSEAERWIAVPASKYLKHRAIGWREAESLDELPPQWHSRAEAEQAFPTASSKRTTRKGGR